MQVRTLSNPSEWRKQAERLQHKQATHAQMLSLQVSSQKIRFADHKHALQFLHVLHWLRVNKSSYSTL